MSRLAGLLVALALILPSVAFGADSSITTPDAGKAIDTSTVTSGAGTVHRQGLKLCDPAANNCQAVSSDGAARTKEIRASTPAQSSVAALASSQTCVAANANRLGATVYNDSTAVMRVKLGATASSTSFTARLPPDGYFETPYGYTGVVDCIWESATGNARITELTQ